MDTSGTLEWYDFGAGWFSGVCGLLVGHPADTVKVQQQTRKDGKCALTVGISIVKAHGPMVLYRGLMMPLLSSGIVNAVFFGCYGNTVRALALLHNETPVRSCCDNPSKPVYNGFHWDIFGAGCVAGFITTFVACPFDLVKIKLQVQADNLKTHKSNCPQYTGTYDCFIKLLKGGGLRYVYKGLTPMLWRDTLSYGIYMHLYVSGNEIISNSKSVPSIMVAGAVSGMASVAPIMPVDVVKSRIQADDIENPKYKSMIDCFYKTYKKHGVKFFNRGWTITMVSAAPVNAAVFAAYETFIYVYLKLTGRINS